MDQESNERIDMESENTLIASSEAGFLLTAGDLEIFKLIYEFRFLQMDHLVALTGRSAKRLDRRLLKLRRAGYLTTLRKLPHKYIYALARGAVCELVEQGSVDESVLADRLRAHELKDLFLKHEMLIVDLHVMLSLASRTGDLRLIDWREGRSLYDSVSVPDREGLVKLPIRPDAFFTLEDSRRPSGANRAHFFLEADRSTSSQARFTEKIRAYWHYLEQGLHAKKFKIKNFRTLTVTLTHERAENLCALAASIVPERTRKYYLFTSLKNFSLDNVAPILETVYLSPRSIGTDVRHPLVPPPTPTQIQSAVL